MTIIGTSATLTDEWTTTANILAGYKYTSPDSFTASAIYLYINDITGTSELQLGIYEDNAGSPNDMLGQTAELIGSGSTWTGGSLGTPVFMSGNSAYWLAAISPNTIRSPYDASGLAAAANSETYAASTMPASFNNDTPTGSVRLMFYATDNIATAQRFKINGTATAIQPYMQKWRGIPIAVSHSKRQLLSGNWEIDLAFDSASITFMREWADAASSGSKNMTVLDQYQLGWTDLSSVQLEMVEHPPIESGMAGPWTMMIRGASPSS